MENLLKGIGISTIILIMVYFLILIIRPVTKKTFTQSWHYYVSFTPVFFMLGGTHLFMKLFSFIKVSLLQKSNIIENFAPPIIQKSNALTFANVTAAQPISHFQMDTILLIGTIVWTVGVIVFLFINFANYHQFKRGLLKHSEKFHTSLTKVTVLKSRVTTTPILIGVFKPKIILPNIEITQNELRLIITHELIHLRQKDILLKFITLIANALHWFNPIAYLVCHNINTLCENACDEKVVQNMNNEDRKFYGEMILNVLSKAIECKTELCTGLCTTKKGIERRLTNIMNIKRSKKSIIALSMVTALTITSIGGITAFSIDEKLPDNQFTATTIYREANKAYQIENFTTVGPQDEANNTPEAWAEILQKVENGEILWEVSEHITMMNSTIIENGKLHVKETPKDDTSLVIKFLVDKSNNAKFELFPNGGISFAGFYKISYDNIKYHETLLKFENGELAWQNGKKPTPITSAVGFPLMQFSSVAPYTFEELAEKQANILFADLNLIAPENVNFSSAMLISDASNVTHIDKTLFEDFVLTNTNNGYATIASNEQLPTTKGHVEKGQTMTINLDFKSENSTIILEIKSNSNGKIVHSVDLNENILNVQTQYTFTESGEYSVILTNSGKTDAQVGFNYLLN